MWPFRRQRTYQITPDRDEWVAPEDTLVDASSSLSMVEVPVSGTIFRVSYLLSVLVTVALLSAAGWMAIGRYDYFSQLTLRNKTVHVSVAPPRGTIFDRNGVPLVENVPSFDVLVISRQVHRNADGTLEGIASMSEVLGQDPELLMLFLGDAMQKNAVFFLATDISRDQLLTLRTVLPVGFYLVTSTKRNYINGPQFSHIIGYVGKVSRQDMVRDDYYGPADTIGRLGVESSYEDVLRGTHGQLRFASSQRATNQAPISGGNVVLNIDARAQKALFEVMFNVLRDSGLSEGAAVVQDPQNGAVLAMVSFPTYDNNIFNSQISQDTADTLFSSKLRPLFNRVISGAYNPGSTIKPFIGMTALQEKVVTATQVVANDCISISIANPSSPNEPYVFKNWRIDLGPFTLRRAIANSCNVYFFTVGGGFGNIIGLGVERIVAYLKSAFSNSILGIDLPGEDHGFLPTPEWKYETKKEPWYQGDTYNISIGQGDLLVTPLWLNTYVSAIANGGMLWRPQVAARIVDAKQGTLATYPPSALGKLPFSQDVIREMQRAMRETVLTGTAGMFEDLPVTSAAKTGTAEVIKGKRINSFLTVFAPAENPRVAMTVLIEGSASNQGYALHVSHDFLKWYFAPRASQ